MDKEKSFKGSWQDHAYNTLSAVENIAVVVYLTTHTCTNDSYLYMFIIPLTVDPYLHVVC